MGASILSSTRAGRGASSWRSRMPRACACFAGFWTRRLDDWMGGSSPPKRKCRARGARHFPWDNPSVRVPKPQIEFPPGPASVIEALANGVEIGNHRLVAQVYALGGDGEVLSHLVAGR